MAENDTTSHFSSIIAINSYDTALCVIPPADQCTGVDQLRSLYDKGWRKWPPHINLIYPFVSPENLQQAKEQIHAQLANISSKDKLEICLDQAGYFAHRNNNTVYICESKSKAESCLDALRTSALGAIGQDATPCNFHLTIGQSEEQTQSSRDFLFDKAKLIPALGFQVNCLAILIRERIPGRDSSASQMRLWGTIDISAATAITEPSPLSEFWLNPNYQDDRLLDDAEELEDAGESDEDSTTPLYSDEILPGTTYCYNTELGIWAPCGTNYSDHVAEDSRTIASYNVFVDSEYPPTRERYPLLLQTILSRSAISDILVLQEVSDDFLSYILAQPQVQDHYPFATHGPPDQPDVYPLPSLRNVVVLSKFHFSWETVPFHRRHKGAVVAMFNSIREDGPSESPQLVVAGVHLTSGLTDGSVAAKKSQLQCLKSYLARQHPESAWIVAGDFNMTTSSYTIETALKNKSISQQTARTLASIETMMADIGFLDAWSVARVEAVDDVPMDSDDLFEGEDGATFNPRENELAALTSGTSLNRPQRYDRILVQPRGMLRIKYFNHFGLPGEYDGVGQVPSDHWGIRALVDILPSAEENHGKEYDTLKLHPVEPSRIATDLASTSTLTSVLANHGMFPTDEEIESRKAAFELIKEVILGTPDVENSSRSDIPIVMVTVGSYALGVWSSASDIDCLCIGSISSRTFFKLARQRIHQAQNGDVRLLRKVEANTGTMLELSVNGVSVDLQYCPAAKVVQRWSEIPDLHHTDSIFNLPMLSLRKLKPYRDITYIQRSLPFLSTFRVAYRCIKLWAVQRGIYSSKFGYLGGIHITLMLSWICKRLAHDVGTVTATDVIGTFFRHYAHFDWDKDIVFDGFFHKEQPRYHRTAREPMVVLGMHTPNTNVSHTSTVPGLNTIIKEFKSAHQRLSEDGMTWEQFLLAPEGPRTGVTEFLRSHDTYVQITVQYWGRSLAKGKGLVGWVESRSLSLVVDINKALPNLDVRIWPARFTSSATSDSKTDYQGCFLIGLSKTGDSDLYTSKEEKLQARHSLEKVFSRSLNHLRGDEKHYDSNTCWIDISLAKPSEVQHLQLDTREWGDYVPDSESDSDSDDEPAEPEPESEQIATASRHKLPIRSAPSSAPVSTTKLRPASDVLNRLRWDPSLDPGEYIVGYEDRFLGAKETSLARWKTEQTDEEFIPQHRILYFKRRGDGCIVWERRTRIDLIFGSGAGAG